MTTTERPAGRHGAGLVLASRGDALTPYLRAALERRYPLAGLLDPELRTWQRLLVAATTFRPARVRWIELFYKSGLAYRIRSRNARRRGRPLGLPGATVLQVHALFDVPAANAVIYVDCTHRQSMRLWPAWNPLRGRALRRWLDRERHLYRDAAHILAFSAPTRHSLLEDYGVPAERVTVVGAGVNLPRLPDPGPAADEASRTPENEPVILFVGNDFERKGGYVLLQAFEKVRAQIPGARLRLVGTRVPIQPQPGVEVLGRITDRGRVMSLYRDATAFCLPSLFDPYPLALLEAMAHGLPCVTTDTCGVPEVLTDGEDGVLVPAGDADALAQALIAVLTDAPRAAALGAAAGRRVRTAFTWDHVVARSAPVLDRLLAP